MKTYSVSEDQRLARYAQNFCRFIKRFGTIFVARAVRKMRCHLCSLPAIGILFVLSGCAGTTTVPITLPEGDSEARGIRHYGELAPFVLVVPDGKGGVTTSLIYITDTSQLYSSRPYAFLSSNNTELNFDKGVIGNTKAIIDETVVPKAAIEAIKTAAAAAAKAFFDSTYAESGQVVSYPPPALFRINIKSDGQITLRGGYGKDPSGVKRQDIKVTIPKIATAN